MSKAVLQYSVINGIILFLILMYKKRSLLTAKYFLLLYLVFIIAITEQLWIGTIFKTTWYTYSEFPIRFLFSPLFFLYVATYLNPSYRPNNKTWLFLILPTILDVLLAFALSIYSYYNNLSTSQRLHLVSDQALYIIRSAAAVGFSLYWTIQVLKLIKDFTSRVKNVYAGIDKLQVNWLKTISIVNIVLWSIWLCYLILECFHPISRSSYIPLFLLLSLVIIEQGYFVVLKPDMVFLFTLAHHEIEENRVAEDKETGTGEEKQAANIEAKQHLLLFERLEKYMNDERAYANNNLSLSILSAYLKEPAVMITKAIRIGYNDTFYNYVNRTRAVKFLEQLSNPLNNQFTIDTISIKCGFNSKTTLHKYFKELTGLTPAIAQKKLRSGEESVGSLQKNVTVISK